MMLSRSAKTLAVAGFLGLGFSSTASAQWMVYKANELPNATSENVFKTASVNIAAGQPSDSPVIVESENSIVADPDDATNKLLRFRIESLPHHSFLWRQDLTDPTSAATVVVRAKGMADIERAFELDLDFGGLRETIYIINPTEENANGKITFNEARKSNSELSNMELAINPTEWHTYRFTKDGNAVKVYIDENNTPAFEVTTPTSTSGRSYFRIGDGSSGQANGSFIDWIVWDVSGAYTPEQRAVPGADVLFVKGDMEKAGRLTVFPNPTTDRFAVSHPAARKGATIEVYAANGLKVGTIATDQGATSTNLDLGTKDNGLYTIVYTDGTQRSSSRIIKR